MTTPDQLRPASRPKSAASPTPSARLSMDAVEAAKSGHPGLPMGMADVGHRAVLANS